MEITMIIIFGLILSVSVGAFFALIFTQSIKNSIVRTIVSIIFALSIGFGIVGLMELEYKSDTNKYNNGICSICKTEYKLFDIEHHRNSGDTYYYKCENDHLIKTSNYFSKKA